MSINNYDNLTGKILVASPYAMEGNMFFKSLIYVLKHEAKGSIGLIFNTCANDKQQNLFANLDTNLTMEDLNLDVHLGGPEEIERGFVLHTSEYNNNILFHPNNAELAVSSNLEILENIATNNGPKQKLLILGYTLWKPGEMEHEMTNNLWIVTEPNLDLIFSKENNETKWQMALQSTGINSSDFVPMNASC